MSLEPGFFRRVGLIRHYQIPSINNDKINDITRNEVNELFPIYFILTLFIFL